MAIQRSDAPRREQEAEGIDPKRELDSGKDPEEHALRRATRQDVRDHRGHERELQNASCHGPEFPQVGAALAGTRDEEGADRRNKNREEGRDREDRCGLHGWRHHFSWVRSSTLTPGLFRLSAMHQPQADRYFGGRHGDDEEGQDLAARVLQVLAEGRQS